MNDVKIFTTFILHPQTKSMESRANLLKLSYRELMHKNFTATNIRVAATHYVLICMS